MTNPDPLAELISAWRTSTESYLKLWEQTAGTFNASPAGESLQQEATKNYLGARAAMNDVSRQAAEPLVELAGGVPLSEFRRLADQVHGLHLRLDRIDDQLRRILDRLGPPPAP